MNRDKKILYILSSSIFVLLLGSFFVKIGSSKILTACLLLPLTLITWLLVKKRMSVSINKKEVLLTVSVIAFLYVMLIQLLGIAFGYYKNPYFVTLKSVLDTVLPLVVIIVGSEIIRYVLLSQKNRFVSLLAFLSCVLAEVLMAYNLAGIVHFDAFMDLVGMTLFPAISANVFYHYISKNYGMLPNIAFRLITTLYVYVTATISEIPGALHACIKIVLPIIVMAFVSALFSKKKKNAKKASAKLSAVGTVLAIVIVASVAMLISCQFRFGALVVATKSMTGEINMGDMIIYEQYDDQTIQQGQVIVFADGDARIVHRVVRIENINNEVRYYTKGDANPDEDFGYRTEADIVGLTNVKIPYIGHPTLWLNELLKSN